MATQCQVAENKIVFNHDVRREDNETAFGVAIAMLFVTIITMDEFFGLGKQDVVTDAGERFAVFNKMHPFGPPMAGE
jgi:hypothetical protein